MIDFNTAPIDETATQSSCLGVFYCLHVHSHCSQPSITPIPFRFRPTACKSGKLFSKSAKRVHHVLVGFTVINRN